MHVYTRAYMEASWRVISRLISLLPLWELSQVVRLGGKNFYLLSLVISSQCYV